MIQSSFRMPGAPCSLAYPEKTGTGPEGSRKTAPEGVQAMSHSARRADSTLCTWTFSPGTMSLVARPMGWPYLITGSPRRMIRRAALCPGGISSPSTTPVPERHSPAFPPSGSTAAESSGFSTIQRTSRFSRSVTAHTSIILPQRTNLRPINVFLNIAENGEKSRPDFPPSPETAAENRQRVPDSGSSPLKKA